jgi:hypothetical protein
VGSISISRRRPGRHTLISLDAPEVVSKPSSWILRSRRREDWYFLLSALRIAALYGACELSKSRCCACGELQENAEHPPEADPNIPNNGRNLVEHDHINRNERCNGGEECAGGAR